MSRSSLAIALLAVLTASACSKSAANQDTGASAPVGGNGPKKLVVPTDEGMPPEGGGMTGAGPGTPFKVGGADDKNKLKPEEGKLAIELPADAKPGAETIAKITVTPGQGYHVNTEYPTKLELQPPAGVALAKTTFVAGGSDKAKGDADQLDEKALVLSVKLTPSAAGNYTINGTFKFAVCAADQCLAKKESIALQIAAK